MKHRQEAQAVQILVHAPMRTKDVMMALRDWKPVEGVQFTLAKRRGADLLFDVSTPVGAYARDLAAHCLEQAGLGELPGLRVMVQGNAEA